MAFAGCDLTNNIRKGLLLRTKRSKILIVERAEYMLCIRKKIIVSQKTEITKLVNQILITTIEIMDSYPELYRHLDETPLFDSIYKDGLSSNDFEEYLIALQSQLEQRNHSVSIYQDAK